MDPIWRIIERNLHLFRDGHHNEKNTEQLFDWLGRGLRDWFINQGLSAEEAEELSVKTVCQIVLKFEDADMYRSGYWLPGDFQNWCVTIAAKQHAVVAGHTITPPQAICNAIQIAIDLLASRDRWLISWYLRQTDDDTAAAAVGVSIDDLKGDWGREALKRATLRFRELYEGDSELLEWIEQPEDRLTGNDLPGGKPSKSFLFVSTKPRKE